MTEIWERTKDPDEIVDYDLSWEAQMTADSDTITSSIWIIPDGITKDADYSTTTRTKVWLSGGTAGEQYTLVNRVVTEGGRTLDQSVKLKVRER